MYGLSIRVAVMALSRNGGLVPRAGRGFASGSDKKAKTPSAEEKPKPKCAAGGAGGFLRVEVNGPIAELVMCRSKALNAMSEGFIGELRDAVAWVDQQPELRVVILRAEGKLFCSGLDLKEVQDRFSKSISFVEKLKLVSAILGSKLLSTSPAPKPSEAGPQAMRNQELLRMMQRWHKAIASLHRCRLPVIGAIHNKCIGAGTDLACAVDIRYCTADVEFSMKQTKMAIVPDLGQLQFISRLVGSGIARDMAFTGRDIKAPEALQIGFVNKVFETQEEMLAGARALAAEIAANSPLAVQGAKYILNFAEEHNLEDGLEQMAMWNAAFLKSEDLFSAIGSFTTKTKPSFSNFVAPPPQ